MISIIVTTYNRPRLLQRCIHSLVEQKLVDEIIIVDDACNKLVERYVTFVNKRIIRNITYHMTAGSEGACVARNLGVEKSKSKFITFVDDDDYILPNRYECLRLYLLEDRYAFYSTGRLTDIDYGGKLYPTPGQVFGEISFSSLIPSNHIDISMVCNKANFKKVGGFNPKLLCFHDWNLALNLTKEFKLGYKIKKFSYVVNEDSNITRITNSGNHRNGYLNIIRDFKSSLSLRDKIIIYCEASSRSNRLTIYDYSAPLIAIFFTTLVPLKRSMKKVLIMARRWIKK